MRDGRSCKRFLFASALLIGLIYYSVALVAKGRRWIFEIHSFKNDGTFEEQDGCSSPGVLELVKQEVGTFLVTFRTTVLWSLAQLLRSFVGDVSWSRNVEQSSWSVWEQTLHSTRNNTCTRTSDNCSSDGNSTQSNILAIPTMRFLPTSCKDKNNEVESTISETLVVSTTDDDHYPQLSNHSVTSICWEKECGAINKQTKPILERYQIDLSKPLLIHNIWESYVSTSGDDGRLSIDELSKEPLGNLSIQYFTDASQQYALKPDGVAPLKDIVYNITHMGGREKLGTQIPVERYPDLIRRVAPQEIVAALFGDRFKPSDVQSSWTGPAWTTVPIFLARGLDDGRSTANANKNSNLTQHTTNSSTQQLHKDAASSRSIHTGLHCEPIGNVALQLHGKKLWTLVDPEYWRLLRPGVSKHGRAFFSSSLDLDQLRRSNVPYYQVITNEGDALWVPPWTWHRVEYIPESVSLAASLFHFRPLEFLQNQPLFAFLLIPNLIKELTGIKTE